MLVRRRSQKTPTPRGKQSLSVDHVQQRRPDPGETVDDIVMDTINSTRRDISKFGDQAHLLEFTLPSLKVMKQLSLGERVVVPDGIDKHTE